MPFPDEGLAVVTSAGSGFSLDRRSARRDDLPPAPIPPALRTTLEFERPSIGNAHQQSAGPARLAPLARSAARALEPAFVAARAMSERIHRPRTDTVDLLAEAELLEAAGEGEAAFRAFGSALLAAPLDASPVRHLERLATVHGQQLALAELYVSVVAGVGGHPSASTLLRRAGQLRALAAGGSPPGAGPDAEAGGSARSGEARAGEARAGEARVGEARAGEARAGEAPAGEAPAGEARADEARVGEARADEARAGEARVREARVGEARADEARAGEARAGEARAGEARVGEARAGAAVHRAGARAADSVPDASSPAGRGGAHAGSGAPGAGREESPFTLEPGDFVVGAPASREEEPDLSHAARTVPLFSPPADPESVPFGARLLAWTVDLAVLAVIPFASVAAGSAAFSRPGLSWLDQLVQAATQSRALVAAALLLVLLIAFVYLTLGLAIGGRTIGDRFAGLRSVDIEHGGPPDLPTAALRSALAIVGTLAFLAGPLWALVDRQGQSLHDKVVGTRTIRC